METREANDQTLQDFLLMLLFRDLIDSLFLLLITLMVLKKQSFYDQPISDQIKKYDEIKKIAT